MSWIEERLKMQVMERPRAVMWVKGHQGTAVNEEADRRAKREVEMGIRNYGCTSPTSQHWRASGKPTLYRYTPKHRNTMGGPDKRYKG